MKSIFDKYFLVQAKICLHLLLRGKFTLKKVLNVVISYISYIFKFETSGKTPFMINFELWNECNEACLFCRSNDGTIFNYDDEKTPIPKGKLDIDVYKKIIDQTYDNLVLSVPYINGEPLLSKDVYTAIEYAHKKKVGTLIASNGIILNEKNINKLIDSGLDFLKVHISGMTNEVHQIEHRKGDVYKILNNIKNLVKVCKQRNYKMLIMLDWIDYKHNKHQFNEAKKFAMDLDIIFNVRAGNPKGLEEKEDKQYNPNKLPLGERCIWLWTVLTVDWNGALYPCCDHVVFGLAEAYKIIKSKDQLEEFTIANLWNGEKVKTMRRIHIKKGREPIPICAQCPRTGIGFKF